MDSTTSLNAHGGASASPLPVTPENLETALADSTGALQLPLAVSQWEKNSREAFRVSLTEYKGKALVDCRIFYLGDDGEYKPSPKGISATLNHLPALADGICKALAIARHQGLVEGGET
jgi:Transcriptional Coactivator p15 (PC4)